MCIHTIESDAEDKDSVKKQEETHSGPASKDPGWLGIVLYKLLDSKSFVSWDIFNFIVNDAQDSVQQKKWNVSISEEPSWLYTVMNLLCYFVLHTQ